MTVAASDPMDMLLICQKDKLTKIKRQLSSRKLIATSREDLLNVALTLFLSSVHCAPYFAATVNYFSPRLKQLFNGSCLSFFSLLCGIIVLSVERS